MNSPTHALSEYIAKAKFEDISENVLEDAKDYILDSLGCAIGGAKLQPAKVIIDLFTELGGHPEASILATEKKLPCIHTAYVNSYLANPLDFDDTYTAPLAHPGALRPLDLLTKTPQLLKVSVTQLPILLTTHSSGCCLP